MADIIIQCSQCGKDNKVSEYAAPGTVKCKECGAALEVPETASSAKKLTMRRVHRERGESLRGSDVEKTKPKDPVTHVASSAVLKDVHKAREKSRTPLQVWGWLAFIAFAGILVGVEYYVTVINPQFFQYYLYGRLGVWGFVALLVVIVAFEEGLMPGFFCLLLPFYILYYAFVRVEYYWLRGIFMGVVVAMAAELYYLPENAALVRAQQGLNTFIAQVGRQIERASDSPDMPQQYHYRRGHRRVPTRPARPKNLPNRR